MEDTKSYATTAVSAAVGAVGVAATFTTVGAVMAVSSRTTATPQTFEQTAIGTETTEAMAVSRLAVRRAGVSLCHARG